MKNYTIKQWHKQGLKTGLSALLLALLAAPVNVSARHIIGGVMSYECLGGNNYRFTLKVYRDCFCTDCAELDPTAAIAVYRCTGDAECGSQSQNNPFRELEVRLRDISNVTPPDYPCLIPPAVCVQEGIYEFTLNLPQSQDSYHIAYQRCCRNVTIDNLVDPGDSGATFTIELTPLAQSQCNNSPTFDTYPPSIICNGLPFEYDHSATDPDGDQLIYEFCSPLLGGGNQLGPLLYTTCIGASPIPACPPPYDPVAFRAPNFSPSQPMGGSPIINIDPLTGLITGTPNLQGQFVVGVCVSEYRNGLLLSRVFRDFQFNVANCDPTVVADIEETSIINGQQFVVNSCGDSSVVFGNQSFQRQFISNFFWEFDLGGGNLQRFNQWEPAVDFPGPGQYQGRLVLNENTNCGDTAQILVNIFPPVTADFSFEYDTCRAGPVTFTDLSQTGACCLTNWNWNFGDGQSATRQNPQHIYTQPGNLPVELTVRDTNGCTDSRIRTIPYFPAPAIIVISPSAALECVPAEIFFDNLSFPIDETYDISWNFGDGSFSTDISPTHTYEQTGIFTVSIDITSPIGCRVDTTFNSLITILPSPTAGFSYTPDEPSNLQPEVYFTDESSGATRWLWNFGTGANSTLPSPVYTFRDTGVYLVQQIVTHPSGCRDTAIAYIDVFPEVRYHLPNAFTPNGDSVNDVFFGKGYLEGARNFQFTIWNRWGELVFETNNPNDSWNGRKNNSGAESPPGVYLVWVSFAGPRGEPYSFKGYVTLLR